MSDTALRIRYSTLTQRACGTQKHEIEDWHLWAGQQNASGTVSLTSDTDK
jgi:hypothetical protein